MIQGILNIIGSILYPLFSIFFLLILILQQLFEIFGGFGGTVWYRENGAYMNYQEITAGNDGTVNNTGIVYYLLQSQLIKNMLISIAILALFLLVIFTAMAFIKNVYSSKPKKWQDIVANAFKGLINFIFVPVCCLLGVWAGNILLGAIAGATSSSGSTDMARQLFICAAYNANRYRVYGSTDDGDMARYLYKKSTDKDFDKTHEEVKILCNNDDQQIAEYYAQIVDECYGNNLDIVTHVSVLRGYTLVEVNYMIIIIGGIFILYILANLTYAMIKRLFILLMLFVISPAMAAMYPIDEGNAINGWKKDFIKNTVLAYTTVAGMNLFFSIYPLVKNIKLLSWGGYILSLPDMIAQLILMIVGLFCVKEFIDMLGGYIGQSSALSAGEGLRGKARGSIKKHAKTAVSGAFRYGSAYGQAAKDSWGKSKGKNIFARTGLALGATLGKGTLKTIPHAAKTAAEDTLNAMNRSAAETLGLKSKDMHFDTMDLEGLKNPFKKGNFKENLGAIGGNLKKVFGAVKDNNGFTQTKKELKKETEERQEAFARGEFGEKKVARELAGTTLAERASDIEKANNTSNILSITGHSIGAPIIELIKAASEEAASEGVDVADFAINKLGFGKSQAGYSEVTSGVNAVLSLNSMATKVNEAGSDKERKALASAYISRIQSLDAGGSAEIQTLIDVMEKGFAKVAAGKASSVDSTKMNEMLAAVGKLGEDIRSTGQNTKAVANAIKESKKE